MLISTLLVLHYSNRGSFFFLRNVQLLQFDDISMFEIALITVRRNALTVDKVVENLEIFTQAHFNTIGINRDKNSFDNILLAYIETTEQTETTSRPYRKLKLQKSIRKPMLTCT